MMKTMICNDGDNGDDDDDDSDNDDDDDDNGSVHDDHRNDNKMTMAS